MLRAAEAGQASRASWHACYLPRLARFDSRIDSSFRMCLRSACLSAKQNGSSEPPAVSALSKLANRFRADDKSSKGGFSPFHLNVALIASLRIASSLV